MSDVVRRPSARAVLAEQIRAVGLSLRGEALLLGVLVGFISFGVVMAIWRESLVVDLRTDNHPLFAMLGALMPFAVWFGRDRLREGSFFVMPVEHRRHALLRALAGLFWLLVVVSALLLWHALLTLVSGGSFGAETTRLVLANAQAAAAVDAATLREVSWTTPAWQWLLPFTSATIAYALMSALNLATKHPLRVVGGVLIAILLLGAATGEYVFEWLRIGLHYVLVHPWGLDTVLLGGSESLKTQVHVPAFEYATTTVWRALPTLGAWLGATLLWSVLSIIALWAATLRLRER